MSNEMIPKNTALAKVAGALATTSSLRGMLAKAAAARKSLLLIDVSGSMAGPVNSEERRIDVLRRVVADLLRTHAVPIAAFGLRGPDSVALVTAIPEPAGGTPLDEALIFAKSVGATHAVVVSDGEPNDAAAALAAAAAFGGQIDAFYVGRPGEPGDAFMKQLVKVNPGPSGQGGSSGTTDLADPKQLTAGIAGLLTA